MSVYVGVCNPRVVNIYERMCIMTLGSVLLTTVGKSSSFKALKSAALDTRMVKAVPTRRLHFNVVGHVVSNRPVVVEAVSTQYVEVEHDRYIGPRRRRESFTRTEKQVVSSRGIVR